MYPTHPPSTAIWTDEQKIWLHIDMYINGKMVYLTPPYDEFEIVSNIQAPRWKDRPSVNPDHYGVF